MANPTTNYSFVLPTSSDLVTDLPADFDVALQGVDTRLKALQPGTTAGDLAYSSATANTNVRLGIGTTGQVLAVVAGVPAWATTADQTPLTTKGDLFTFSTVDARLPVGTNGQVLTADSSEATGLKFATPAAGGGWTLIASGAVSGSTFTISSIPQTFKNIRIQLLGWSASADGDLVWKINNTTANTFQISIPSNGVASEFQSGTSGAGIRLSSSSVPGSISTNIGVLDILDYTNTTAFKVFQSYSLNTQNPATPFLQAFIGGGGFASNSAVTSLVFDPESTNTLDAGVYYLWGEN